MVDGWMDRSIDRCILNEKFYTIVHYFLTIFLQAYL